MELYNFYEVQEDEVFVIAIGKYNIEYLGQPKTSYNTIKKLNTEIIPSSNGLSYYIFKITRKYINDS